MEDPTERKGIEVKIKRRPRKAYAIGGWAVPVKALNPFHYSFPPPFSLFHANLHPCRVLCQNPTNTRVMHLYQR